MAIKGNEASEGGSQVKLYTGIGSFRVVAVNPTQEQLKALGYKAEKEPVYKDEKHGSRVVFHIEAIAPGGDKIKTNIAFFIKDKRRTDIFINKIGKFSKDQTKVLGEARNPYEGEIELLNFIADWANVNQKKEEELYLDSIDRIATTGDVSEISQILLARKDNIFKALAVVQDGKYQRVYSKRTARSWSTDYSYLHKSLVENKDYIKEDLGGIDFAVYVPSQFILKPWTGSVGALATAAFVTSQSNGNGHATAGSEAAAADDDDLPF